MRLLVIDRSVIYAEGVRSVVSSLFSGVTVDHSASLDVLEALHSDDHVLLDIAVNHEKWMDGMREVLERAPEVRFVVNAPRVGTELMVRVLDSGGAGIFYRDGSAADLRAVFAAVAHGGQCVPMLGDSSGPGGGSSVLLRCLSVRQRQILDRVAQGRSNKAIARELNLSVGTVKNQLHSMFKTLSVSNRTEAAGLVLHGDPLSLPGLAGEGKC